MRRVGAKAERKWRMSRHRRPGAVKELHSKHAALDDVQRRWRIEEGNCNDRVSKADRLRHDISVNFGGNALDRYGCVFDNGFGSPPCRALNVTSLDYHHLRQYLSLRDAERDLVIGRLRRRQEQGDIGSDNSVG